MARRIRALDWNTSPLGPPEAWPHDLRFVVDMMLCHAFPVAVLWGPEFIVLYNDLYPPYYGNRHSAAVGQPNFAVWPEAREQVEPILRKVWAGETVKLERALITDLNHRDKGDAWYDTSLSPLRDEGGETVGILMTAFDVTERVLAEHAREESGAALRASEERQAFLLTLSDALRVLDDPQDVARTACRLLVDELHGSRAQYTVMVEDESGAQIAEIWGEHVGSGRPMVSRFPMNAYGVEFVDLLRRGETLVLDDIDADPRISGAQRQALHAAGSPAAVAVPHVRDGRLVATFTVHDRVPRAWTALEIALVEDVAERTWAAVERARAETALRESEARFAQFAASTSDVLWIRDAETMTLEYISPAFETVFGVPAGDVEGGIEPGAALVDAADRDRVTTHLDEARRGEPQVYEFRIVRRSDGATRWVRDHCFPLFDKCGGVERIGGIARDVTDIKQAEAALRDSEARYHALFSASPVPFMVLDANPPDFTILAANEAYFKATLTTPETLIGRRLFDVFTDDPTRPGQLGSEALDVSLERVLRTARTDAMERVRYDIVTPEGRFEPHWWLAINAPLLDADGNVAAIIHQVDRQTELHYAEEALRESEARHRLLIGSWAQAVWETDADGVIVADSPSWRAYTGQTLDEWLGYGWLDAVHPDDRAYAERQWREAIAARGLVDTEFRLRSSGGGWRWTNVRAAPVLDSRENVQKWVGMNIDIHDSKVAREAREESERFSRALVEGMPQLVWRAAPIGEWTWASPQWTEFTGQPEQDSRAWGWLIPLHPDDRAKARAAWAEAVTDGALDVEYRVRHAGSGSYRWFHTRASPVCDEGGTVVEWLGTSTDVDELRRLQDLQKTLLAELQHRVRNVLAVIRSMMRRSSESQESLSDYVQHLEGRLSALARTQALLTRAVDARVDLEDLIRDELAAQAADEDRITLKGNSVGLGPKAAEVLSLAIHELTTNAIKYGALSGKTATLNIAWQVEERGGVPWLMLAWAELGVPVTSAAPRRQGFGSELITRRVPYELKGRGSLEMRPGGIECRLEFPLRDRASILQTDARPATTVG